MQGKRLVLIKWILRLVPALIMLQTLFFKFSVSEESVFIFSQLGMEPWGRIGTGVMELLASILLLIPYTTIFGALISIGLMTGALFFHFTILGIEVMNDGGLLFIYSLVVLLCSFILICLEREKMFSWFKRVA